MHLALGGAEQKRRGTLPVPDGRATAGFERCRVRPFRDTGPDRRARHSLFASTNLSTASAALALLAELTRSAEACGSPISRDM